MCVEVHNDSEARFRMAASVVCVLVRLCVHIRTESALPDGHSAAQPLAGLQLWIAKCAGAAADQQFDWDGPLIRQRQVRRTRLRRRPTGGRARACLLCSRALAHKHKHAGAFVALWGSAP